MRMSLSSFLLGKRNLKKDKDVDEDLDALFRSSVCLPQISALPGVLIACCVQISTPSPAPTTGKIAIKRRGDAVEDAAPSKRKKSVNDNAQPSVRPIPSTNEPASHSKKTKEGNGKRVSKKTTKTENVPESGNEENSGQEEVYERKVRPGKQVASGSSRDEERPNDASDSEEDASQLIHETMMKNSQRDKTRSRHVQHHVPPDETKEQRDARTIFLGNVPMEVAKSKVRPLSFSLPHSSHRLSVCPQGLQEIYYVTCPGSQDRVLTLSFCRIPEANTCCTRTTHTQPRTHGRLARDERRRDSCTPTAAWPRRQKKDRVHKA